MKLAPTLASASFLTLALAGCTVATAPSSSSSESTGVITEADHEANGREQSAVPGCVPPITPVTGEWSCGSSGVRTGEKMATTSAGYAANCADRATVELSVPSCGTTAKRPQNDEIFVTAVGPLASSASACEGSYLDYTITLLGTTTGEWSVGASGRAYGVFSNGSCHLAAPPYYTASGESSRVEVSAAASEPAAPGLLEPAAAALLARFPVEIVRTPLNVTFDVSFE